MVEVGAQELPSERTGEHRVRREDPVPLVAKHPANRFVLVAFPQCDTDTEIDAGRQLVGFATEDERERLAVSFRGERVQVERFGHDDPVLAS